MAQVALGAVGAVIGFYVGGPAGAGLGWSIGAAAGGVLFPPKGPHTEGPRLTDLKQQLSTYGAPKPILYGRIATAGCVMWTADVIEVSTTEESGKGEPSSSSTSYTYFWSGAILIAKAPLDGSGYHALLRIWVNGRVFYDVRDTTNAEAQIASANFATYFTWYSGTDTQSPDPTMEAALGVGNVPGYRYRSYIVFHDLPLSLFNNYPPGALNFQFEIQREGPTTTGIQLIADNDQLIGNLIYPVTSGVIRQSIPATAAVGVYDIQGEHIINDPKTDEEAAWPTLWTGSGDKAVMLFYDGSTCRGQIGGTTEFGDAGTVLYAEFEGTGGTPYDAKPLFDPTHVCRAIVPCADRRHILVMTGVAAGITDGWTLLQWTGAGWLLVDSGTADDDCEHFGAVGSSSQGQLYFSAMLESDLRHSWALSGGGGPDVDLNWINDSGHMVLVENYDKIPGDPFSFVTSTLWADEGLCYTGCAAYYNLFTRAPGAGANTQILSDVHGDICLQAGLTAGQIDVTELTDEVDGFRVIPIGAGRAFIAHLERAYWYDTVETGGKIKAVKRGQSSVVTIPQDDLAAYSADSGANEDAVINDRADEDSLPAEIAVGYLTKDADYQVGVQLSQREATYSQQPTTVELPLVLSDLKAKEVGEVLLYDAWLGRTRRSFKTSRKYSYLEPTDVVTLELDEATYVVRIISMRINGGILEFESVDEDDSIYEPNSVAGAIIDPNPGIVLIGPTLLALMDLPALRPEDSNAGFYMGATGYYDNWAGMQLFMSTDAGANYTAISATSSPATIGFVADALEDYIGGNFYDVTNSITVQLRSGTLTSITDAQLYAGANAFALGNEAVGYEVIQFKTATLLGGKTYILTQLLRGRKGTERLMGTHVANEKFVLLNTSLTRVPMEIVSLDSARLYKPVTFLQTVAETTAVSFTNTGSALKPYSPVHARILRDASDDMVIYWIRRGRLNNEWMNNVDVPLSEASEEYEVEIYSGATLKRTLTSSVQSVAYTAAQETTDFGSPQSSISIRIYQLSADVGRGFGFIGSVPVIG